MKTLPFILITCLLLLSCTEKEEACIGLCTEEFRSIVVQIEYSAGEPVILDSFEVIDITNGRDITLQQDDFQRDRGIYSIFNDRYVADYRQQQIQIKFTGFIDGREVVSEIYKVGADCCHVFHILGDLELVI